MPLGYFSLCPKLMFESEAKREAIDVNFFFFLMQIRLILQKCLALL